MNRHACRLSLVAAVALLWVGAALAQDPAAVAPVAADPMTIALMQALAGSPYPFAAVILAWGLRGFTPTIRLEHHVRDERKD